MKLTEKEIAWLSGYLSAQGTFTISAGKTLLRVSSSRDQESVARLAFLAGVNASTTTISGKETTRLTVAGDKLHWLMREIWTELSRYRRQDYARVRARAHAIQEEQGLILTGAREI